MTRQPARGLTLIELMVTVAIAAIMMTIAAPSLQAFVRSTQLRTAANDLAAVLAFARSESIKRGWPVTVCKSSTTTSATPSCSTTANWQDGWLVFVDHNQNGTLDTTASASFPADSALRVGTTGHPAMTLGGGTDFAQYLTFRSSGFPLGSNATEAGRFTFCLSPQSRILDVSKTGRIQITSGSCT